MYPFCVESAVKHQTTNQPVICLTSVFTAS